MLFLPVSFFSLSLHRYIINGVRLHIGKRELHCIGFHIALRDTEDIVRIGVADLGREQANCLCCRW